MGKESELSNAAFPDLCSGAEIGGLESVVFGCVWAGKPFLQPFPSWPIGHQTKLGLTRALRGPYAGLTRSRLVPSPSCPIATIPC